MARRNPSPRPRRAADKPLSVLPLHHRIYMVLRRRLVEGTYPADRPLPGEHQLAEDFNASRVTIRRVLERLDEEKMISRRHGVGTFPTRPVLAPNSEPEMSYWDYIAASSHAYDNKLIGFNHLPTPAFLTQVDPRFGPVALKIERVAFIKREPLHILRTYVPGDIAKHVQRRVLANKTVLELLKKKAIVPQDSELRIGAMAADTAEARLLQVTVGAPLVHAIRISRLTDGRAIEYHEMLSVADSFGYRFFFDWRVGAIRMPRMDAASAE